MLIWRFPLHSRVKSSLRFRSTVCRAAMKVSLASRSLRAVWFLNITQTCRIAPPTLRPQGRSTLSATSQLRLHGIITRNVMLSASSPRPTKRARIEDSEGQILAPNSMELKGLAMQSHQGLPTTLAESRDGSNSPSQEPAEQMEQVAPGTDEQPIRKSYAKEIHYENKLVLAPMVRSGWLPTRLLSLHYGAGLVWGPEVVDKAIIGAERTVDEATGVIAYNKPSSHGENPKPIFTCHPVEKPFLIYQIGSSNPELAVKAALTVEQDVAGFVHAGMGAALLSTPDLLISILRALITHTSKPVSAKIRMLPDQQDTMKLARRIMSTGIKNLTVHCRTRDMRSTQKAMWHRLREIVDLGKEMGIPVICNGDGEGWANWQQIREETGATSVMIARAAESNPSIFLPTGPVSTCERLIPETFLPVCLATDNHYSNTKFLLYQHKPSPQPISQLSKAEKKAYQDGIQQAKGYEDICRVWGLGVDETRQRGQQFLVQLKRNLAERDPSAYADEPADQAWEKVSAVKADVHANVWEERKVAEAEGTNIDAQDQVALAKEEADDEEAALNG